MIKKIKSLLEKENIFLYVFFPLDKCVIKKQYLLDKNGIKDGFAVIFAIPYYTRTCENDRNISAYAVGRDYHFFIKELEGRILPKLKESFPHTPFALFADHSPIDERDAAARAGLGIFGKNRLLITEPYSSYVFLAELIVGAPLPDGVCKETEIGYCENCGACVSACPWQSGECGECLSALTQKKGELDESEKELIKKYSLWGCDICTEVCPHTKKAKSADTIYSPIEFFSQNAIAHLTYETVADMDDAEFSKRAYSWRGRETILRNTEIAKNVEINGAPFEGENKKA